MAASKLKDHKAMILAAAAAIGATTRPSGETPQQQRTRIVTGIKAQLAALDKAWTLSWLMMSPGNANLAYIAQNGATEQVVVGIRGTSDNIVDVLEDFDVATAVPFPASGSPTTVWVSQGAMEAFTEIVNTYDPGGDNLLAGSLTEALSSVVAGFPASPTVFVVGHSLGGCIATMVAPFLLAGSFPNDPSFGIVTFAAPSAGGTEFVDYFNSLIGTERWAQCDFFMNIYDLVPQAWCFFENVLQNPLNPTHPGAPWYPKGTVVSGELAEFIKALERVPKNNAYDQPSPSQWVHINRHYELWDKKLTDNTFEDFKGQIAYQHANSTYLTLLEPTAKLEEAPTVTSVTPNWGHGGLVVEVEGTGFRVVGDYPVCVDIGTTPLVPSGFTVNSTTKITITGVPYCSGIVDIRVTTALGTSAASPASQFAYGGPEPARVTSVSPNTGRMDSFVSIHGTGLVSTDGTGPEVYFGRNASKEVTVHTDPSSAAPYLRAKVPAEVTAAVAGKTVDITVAVNGYSSPTSPADEFTYPGGSVS